MLAAILWLAGSRVWPEIQNLSTPLLGLWGIIWGYHYSFTLGLIPTRQPDFLIYGRIFSITLILLGNAFLIGTLIWLAFRPSTWGQALLNLGTEWVWVYSSIMDWLSGLLLRYLPHSA
jgi:hypothetical protein